MRVTVELTERVKPSARSWRRSLSPNRDDQRLFAQTYLDEFGQRAARYAGRVPDAMLDATETPPVWWCQLTSVTWIGYVIEVRGLFRKEVFVKVLFLAPSPPHQARPAAAPP